MTDQRPPGYPCANPAQVEAAPGSLVVSLTDAEAALERLDSKAHAAGWAAAVEALRDGAAYTKWAYGCSKPPHASASEREWAARYLDAVGPGHTSATGPAPTPAVTPDGGGGDLSDVLRARIAADDGGEP